MQNSGAFTQEADTRLWLPGTNAVDARVRAVARAVERYDESFRFARHEITGDWVVCIGEGGFPVFGFGRELPRPEDVEQLLGAHDVKRNGKRILAASKAAAESEQARAESEISEHNGQMAERYEHLFRQAGKHHNPRIFVPGRTW
jgi:hypothetical protein